VEYRLEAKEIDGLKTALEAKGIDPKRKDEYLEFTTEKDSLTKYPDEHKKLLLGFIPRISRRRFRRGADRK